VTFRMFPILKEDEMKQGEAPSNAHNAAADRVARKWDVGRIKQVLQRQNRHWSEFREQPVFYSSLSISLLYLTTLSFDGLLITYLLDFRNYSSPFIAGMRGICAVAGLAGTAVMPILEKKLGLVRAGTWSINSQLLCLIPVLASFFVTVSPGERHGPLWSTVLLFTFLPASRVGLWSIDLVNLKELQEDLAEHPHRNTLMGLQVAMQNIFDLLHYALVIILSHPAQFKWTAVVSVGSVGAAAISYMVYNRKARGHLVHHEWLRLLRKSV